MRILELTGAAFFGEELRKASECNEILLIIEGHRVFGAFVPEKRLFGTVVPVDAEMIANSEADFKDAKNVTICC